MEHMPYRDQIWSIYGKVLCANIYSIKAYIYYTYGPYMNHKWLINRSYMYQIPMIYGEYRECVSRICPTFIMFSVYSIYQHIYSTHGLLGYFFKGMMT